MIAENRPEIRDRGSGTSESGGATLKLVHPEGKDHPRHKDAADSVRALSAAVVVVSHAIQIMWLPVHGLGTWIHWINSFASDAAVIIFFVLSGQMITASIHANIRRNGSFNLVQYVLNRAVRIYPPLLLVIALVVLIYLVMLAFGMPGVGAKLAFQTDRYMAREQVDLSLRDIWNSLSMQNGLLLFAGPLWSLYVEVKLYVLAGLAGFMFFGPWPFPARAAMAVAAVAFGWAAGGWIAQAHWVYAAWWLLGATMFLTGRNSEGPDLLAAASCAVIAGTILALTPVPLVLEATRLAAVLLLSWAMFFQWTWSEPVSKKVAGYSYSLYLMHFPIMIFAYAVLVMLTGPRAPSLWARLATMAVSIAASFVFARLAGSYVEDTGAIKRWLTIGFFKVRHRLLR